MGSGGGSLVAFMPPPRSVGRSPSSRGPVSPGPLLAAPLGPAPPPRRGGAGRRVSRASPGRPVGVAPVPPSRGAVGGGRPGRRGPAGGGRTAGGASFLARALAAAAAPALSCLAGAPGGAPGWDGEGEGEAVVGPRLPGARGAPSGAGRADPLSQRGDVSPEGGRRAGRAPLRSFSRPLGRVDQRSRPPRPRPGMPRRVDRRSPWVGRPAVPAPPGVPKASLVDRRSPGRPAVPAPPARDLVPPGALFWGGAGTVPLADDHHSLLPARTVGLGAAQGPVDPARTTLPPLACLEPLAGHPRDLQVRPRLGLKQVQPGWVGRHVRDGHVP